MFIYREKQHRNKLLYLERQEDILQIELAKQNNIVNIEREIEKEIEKYQYILTPDLHAKTFKNQLEINPEVIISTFAHTKAKFNPINSHFKV